MMKIIDVHIEKMRGIKDQKLSFEGDNAVIVGPNGVGKSAVADAIDFLLTGEVNRLTGEGTKSLTRDLIPFVGQVHSEAKVTATLEHNGDRFTLSRSFVDGLKYDKKFESAVKVI